MNDEEPIEISSQTSDQKNEKRKKKKKRKNFIIRR